MQIKKKNQNDPSLHTQLVSYCPLCHDSFSPRQAAVIGQVGSTHLLHVTCNRCTSSLVVLLLVSELGVSSVGVVTDLAETDVERFAAGLPVTMDDCLDLHALLHSGDQVVQPFTA